MENEVEIINRTVPTRLPNDAYRRREHLTEPEVKSLIAAARARGRNGDRDATAILIAYRHGLRVSELTSLRWEQIDFNSGTMHVTRVKRGDPGTHTLADDEIRSLRRLRRTATGPFIFENERGGPITAAGFTRTMTRAATSIDFPIKVHPHMLRHACGYKLANAGIDTRAIQEFLGHRNIQHTVVYTRLAANRLASIAQLWDRETIE